MSKQCNWTRTFVAARNVVGTMGFVLIVYLFAKSVPDIGRYIKVGRT
jgi:hypothetical protein